MDRRRSSRAAANGYGADTLKNVQRTVPEIVIVALGIVIGGPWSTLALPWRTSVVDRCVILPETLTRSAL